MANLTLGRYVPREGFIHKVDPRVKILALIGLMVAIFFQFYTYVEIDGAMVKVNDWYMTFIMGGAMFVFIAILMVCSKVSFKSLLSSLKSMWFLIIILLIINAIVPPSNKYCGEAFHIKSFVVYWDSIFQSLKIIIRLILMVSLTMILTTTTKPLDLTYALEWFMTPLKVIKFPAHEIAMTISIALRFIPTLLEETERIMKAQESRGVDFKHGKVSSRLKAIISLIVPLFISSFQRSEELADAMEARGYDPRARRTRYHKMRFHMCDLAAFVLVGAVVAGIITISACGWTLSTPHLIPWLGVSGCSIILYMILSGIFFNCVRRN